MKRIFSLILLILLTPCIVVLNACGDKGYQLSGLVSAIEDLDKYETIDVVDNTIKISYDSYKQSDVKFINDLVTSGKKPYSYLNDYNKLFDNLMAFSCEYLDECANESVKVDKAIKVRLENELLALEHDLANIDASTIGWADTIKAAGSNKYSSVCVTKFKNLLKFYDDLFISATNVANTISTIYFEYALNDANPNYYEINIDGFDAGMVANKLNARILDQLSNITQVYIEKNISGGDLADQLTNEATNYGSLDLGNYDAMVNVISNRLVVTNETINRANTNKENFYNTAIELYNIQEVLADNNTMFVQACNGIEYKKVLLDNDPTYYDSMCVEIIDGYDYLISQYNQVLDRLLTMMGV